MTLLRGPKANIYIWDEYRSNPSAFNRRIGVIQGLVTGESISLFLRWGEIGGTLCMRSHISVHRGTIKFRSNYFVFKTEIEKEGLPRDTAPALGAGGPEISRPDQTLQIVPSAASANV
jgi:hypothetical protein